MVRPYWPGRDRVKPLHCGSRHDWARDGAATPYKGIERAGTMREGLDE
jgi:hypothetical protein